MSLFIAVSFRDPRLSLFIARKLRDGHSAKSIAQRSCYGRRCRDDSFSMSRLRLFPSSSSAITKMQGRFRDSCPSLFRKIAFSCSSHDVSLTVTRPGTSQEGPPAACLCSLHEGFETFGRPCTAHVVSMTFARPCTSHAGFIPNVCLSISHEASVTIRFEILNRSNFGSMHRVVRRWGTQERTAMRQQSSR